MKYLILLVISITLLSSCQHRKQQSFFDMLSQYCGDRYYGKTVFPDDPNHDFAGKTLIMDIKHCSDNEIRIPFQVGEDTSRTWLISKTDKGLLLKHDHRHADGTPDEITMYGGYANKLSTNRQVHFAADKHTADLLPEASTNVWILSIDQPFTSATTFTYYLERHDKPRYRAVFSLISTD
jgi:hypothetical protein